METANIYTNVAKYVEKVSNGYDHDPDLIVVSIPRVVQSLKYTFKGKMFKDLRLKKHFATISKVTNKHNQLVLFLKC